MESERLEVAAGRAAGNERSQASRGSRAHGHRRIAVAVALLALSGAWLVFARPSSRTAAARITSSPTSEKVHASGVHVEVWRLSLPDAVARYRTESGATIAAREGAPACARGQPDERAWSRPESPRVISGRYRCRLESGRAAMWWIDEHGVLAHAVASNGDLAALFAWWRAQSGG